MAIGKVKFSSAGRRAVVKVVHRHLHQGAPEASLLEPQKQNAGRNNEGYITMRHKGGDHKHHYRVVDFLRNKDGIPAKVERIEYDPNRTAHIALLCYADGERRYIIAPLGIEAGATLLSGPEAPIKAGNTLPIRNIPVGSIIHCVEMMPGKGAQIARSSGTSVTLMAREGTYAQVRLRSGEVRKIHIDCRATIGEVSSDEHSLRQYGKAGAIRWKGIRPQVGGLAMYSPEFAHSVGEGSIGQGQPQVSPWNTLTKGYRTRVDKRTKPVISARDERAAPGSHEVLRKPSGRAKKASPVDDLLIISPTSDAELAGLLARIPKSQRELVASHPTRLTSIIVGLASLDEYANKLMAPTDKQITLKLIEAPVSDDEVKGSIALGFFPSGAVRTIGTVVSHTRSAAVIEPYNLWSLIDPFDDKQRFEPGANIVVDLHILLLLGR